MSPLPIDEHIESILQQLAGGSAVLIAPPGSGKSTRVPPAILRSGLLPADHQNLIVLQPRRIAARAAAARIAQEQGWELGVQVGYQVRFERQISSRTPLRFMTEGILTRQVLADPFLEAVGGVVLDEFHERSIHTDLALALLAEIKREVRPDMLLLVMSATLETEPVARFLDGCPVVRVPGSAFEVSREYRPALRPAAAESVVPVILEVLNEPRDAGHVLVFLPGLPEIRRLQRRLEPFVRQSGAVVLPLHGSLPIEEQDRALRPCGQRKVILSTNVAETSLTIDGVTTVIDSGLARSVRYDPERATDRWGTRRISRASAEQRTGRAGRTGPGRCIRLWSERTERGLAEFDEPEIHRTDLSATILALHAWGVSDPARFRWFDPPAPDRLSAAARLLELLGALAGRPPRITPLGDQMLTLPIHPRLARLYLAAASAGRSRDGAGIAALLSDKDIAVRQETTRPAAQRRKTEAGAAGDIMLRLEMLADAEASRFAGSLRRRGIDPIAARQVALLRDVLMRQFRVATSRDPRSPFEPQRLAADRRSNRQNSSQDHEEILKWLLLAYPDRVVKRRGAEGTGLMVGGRGARLRPESIVQDSEYFLAIAAREERQGAILEVQISLASPVKLEWLETTFPDQVRRERKLRYEESRQRVISTNCCYYHDLLLREDITPALDLEAVTAVLVAALRPSASELFRDNRHAARWLARVEFLRRVLPEHNWPEFDDQIFQDLLEHVCQGKSARSQIEEVDLIPYLESRLDPRQLRELKESAPESVVIPSGRRVRLAYERGRPPAVAARVQELFGWTETPRVARGTVRILLHILAPNHRPVQITDDLQSFWANTYGQVRKDLRARYPRHSWPEDPRLPNRRAGP
jgi:ATP-dependent helicase HrpB